MVASKIREALEKVVPNREIILSTPSQSPHGDYTTNIALQAVAKGENPRAFAETVVHALKNDTNLSALVSRIEVAGPGFINFFLSDEVLISTVTSIRSAQKPYGESAILQGKRYIVEYSSPNIAKPFTIGHLRSTLIGDAISNLLVNSGATVYRDNHLGDWGTQFGKQIYAIKAWGDEAQIEKSSNPVEELVKLYVRFHEEAKLHPELEDEARAWFKKLEDNDPEAIRIWKKCIEWSMIEFDAIYKELNVQFTENGGLGYGESFFSNKMAEIPDLLRQKGLLVPGDEGAQIVRFENDKYPPLMILKKDGASLYATRDLAADKFRFSEYGRDITIINEVGSEQSLYFQQLFEIEKLLGWAAEGQRVHIKHGMFRFKDGKMSTRKGNVIWLRDVLREAVEKAQALSGDNAFLAKEIGIGALKWNELKRDPAGDIVFDWDEILNMKGNSGPYMQYTVARIQSLLGKAAITTDEFHLSEVTTDLVRKLVKYPEVTVLAAQNYHTLSLTEYLYELAQLFNVFYDTHKIIGSEDQNSSLQVSQSVLSVLKQGLSLLGISTPEKM